MIYAMRLFNILPMINICVFLDLPQIFINYAVNLEFFTWTHAIHSKQVIKNIYINSILMIVIYLCMMERVSMYIYSTYFPEELSTNYCT